MESRALRHSGVAIIATVATLLLGSLAPLAAHAGTIWVTDGGSNCSAFSVYGDFASFSVPSSCPMSILTVNAIPLGQNAYWMTTAPPGITINSAWTANGDVNAGGWTTGVAVGDFWRDVNTGAWGGSTLAQGQQWLNTSLEGSSDINSQIYGIQLVCTQNNWSFGGCGYVTQPWFSVSGIELAGTEASAPYVAGEGALWSTGSSVWNPPGDPWPVTLYASDISGICNSSANAGSDQSNGPPEPRNTTVWQQCPNPVSWSFNVDTRSEVPADGSLAIDLSATNAAGNQYIAQKVVSVDNDPVTVSLASPDDGNPSIWVNHAVTIDAGATAGPSGVAGMNCSVDSASASSYPAGGLTVNGDGTHTVSCTAWNNAVDPQGQLNTGTNSLTFHIDEAPPSLSFQPQNPSDPTALTIDTSDPESGVAGGSVEMAPAGTNDWTTLPTTFHGSHLVTSFDDAGHSGPYAFQATSCDNVGNCTTNSEQLTLPVRTASDSQVSLTKIVKCTTKRVRTHQGRSRAKRNCKNPQEHPTQTLHVPFGHPVAVHGLYTTSQGAPLGGQPVQIFAAPNNGVSPFSQVATVTTAADGSWTATLPVGPSQIIRAVTNGTATILPSSGQVTTVVPARVRLLKVWPRHVGWGGTVHLVGQLLGAYLPPGGALVRLRIGYGSTYSTYGVEEHVMGDGRFSTVASFGPGDPSVHRTYWFQIASLPMGNYPYAPGASQRVSVRVGGHPRKR
jgi:hypothetical protein